MRFVSELYISLGVLLGLALGGAALAGWSANQAAFHLERTELAHRQYQAYLALSNNTYQLFKQFGDSMLIGDRDNGAGESALLEGIRDQVKVIRDQTAREIQLVGEEEIIELDTIARVSGQIETLVRQYRAIAGAQVDNEPARDLGRLAQMLDEKVDEEFSQLIQEAIDEEEKEVRETSEETAAKMALFETLALFFTALAIVASAASLWKLMRDVRMPVLALMEGTSLLSRGNLEHRVEISRPLEFKEVARAFNHMAAELRTRETALTEANAVLEQSVAARTAELEQLLDDLKASEINRRRLFADVSHELRTPLTIIHGEADIALRGDDKQPQTYREALEKCRSAAAHTSRLVEDLLFVARSEVGDIRLRFEPIDLTILLPKIVEEYRNIVETNASTIDIECGVDSAVVRADAGRIQQVVLVLLENALRYGGQCIDVRLDRLSAGFAFRISDDGPGLTAEESERAFDRFFRGPNAADGYDRGAGLGLPIAKAIVEAHGGNISLRSKPDQGMSVTVVLPLPPSLRIAS